MTTEEIKPTEEVKPAPVATEEIPAFKPEIKKVTIDDYTFEVNTDLIDDVDAIEMIDEIENKRNIKAIIDFLRYLIGVDGYEAIKAHYVKKDGRFRLTKLTDIYQKIFENFDPKDSAS